MKAANISSAFVLSAALAVASMQASADLAVGGDETNVDRIVPFSNAWTVLVAEPFMTNTNLTHCIATGSADAMNPNVPGNFRYRFVLSIDNAMPPIDGACERTVSFDNGAVQSIEEVSSTCTFRNLLAGGHTIRWLARVATAGAPPLTVTDNSMTFVCQNNLLDADGPGDGRPE
jgi:hypothetical protein